MIDTHYYHDNWGLYPILFQLGKFQIESYSFFVVLALLTAAAVYYFYVHKDKLTGEKAIYLALAAITGGTIGSKIPIWLIHFHEIFNSHTNLVSILSGRTITGGLIGGTLAVIIVKKILKIQVRKGNIFAPAAALGIAVGRIGCLLRGCCYGSITQLPWGIDFGDHITRHPTQIYEALYCLLLFIIIVIWKEKHPKPGQLFDFFMISYFSFRFFIEFIKFEPAIYLGFTAFQLISILVLMKYVIKFLWQIFKKIFENQKQLVSNF
ncbi:MAG: prolipoprotein diacylglyceryl transferase family protein [bacterium]